MRHHSLDVLLEGNNNNDEVWGNPPFYRPCVDGWVLPYNYEDSLKNGIQKDLPILTGHNSDEGGTYADPEFGPEDFKSCAQQKYGSLSEREAVRDGRRMIPMAGHVWLEKSHAVLEGV
jgi:carboxylesterase 2